MGSGMAGAAMVRVVAREKMRKEKTRSKAEVVGMIFRELISGGALLAQVFILTGAVNV